MSLDGNIMSKGLVTIFGGSGFLGKHVVRAAVKQGWRVRVPVRRPHTAHELKVIGNVGQVQLVQANIRFPESVEAAVSGADAVINLVALLSESGKQNFEAVHVEGAENIARAAAAQGIRNFVQVAALGADSESDSDYSRTKGEAEAIISQIVPSADIMRPSVIFGPEDAFFNRFAAMAQIAPVLPLIGGGETKMQPVYAGDVAAAIAKVIGQGTAGKTYELGGPRVYSFKELMQFTLRAVDRKRALAPVPWAVAGALGFVGEMTGALPAVEPFLTRNQVKDLKRDNVVSDDALGFAELGLSLETLESIVPSYLERYRKNGQFHEGRA